MLRAGDVVQLGECLSSMQEGLDLSPAPHKTGMMLHACDPSTCEAKLEVHEHAQ